MKKNAVAGMLTMMMITLGFLSATGRAWGQEADNSAKSAEKPVEAYRLDFSINEMENGKKVNTRQYSMNLTKNQPQEIKIGSRVPVDTKKDEFQYLDVGTSITGRLHTANEQLELFVNVDMSNFATPEQAGGQDPRPLIRQLKIGGSTLAVLGKPMLIGSADDPNSNRQFQVEVIMTKLK